MKKARYIVWFIVTVLLMNISVFSGVLGFTSTDFNGFAVDSNNRLYVGRDEIEVYENGELLKTINPKTSRAYVFTIQDDDTILLSTASKVFIMDLDGNVINQYEDTYTKIFNGLTREKNLFTAKDGTQYSVKHRLTWLEIVKDNDVRVYRLPMLDFATRITTAVACISLWILVPTLIVKMWKYKPMIENWKYN
jgi:hypothetical protein